MTLLNNFQHDLWDIVALTSKLTPAYSRDSCECCANQKERSWIIHRAECEAKRWIHVRFSKLSFSFRTKSSEWHSFFLMSWRHCVAMVNDNIKKTFFSITQRNISELVMLSHGLCSPTRLIIETRVACPTMWTTWYFMTCADMTHTCSFTNRKWWWYL